MQATRYSSEPDKIDACDISNLSKVWPMSSFVPSIGRPVLSSSAEVIRPLAVHNIAWVLSYKPGCRSWVRFVASANGIDRAT